MTEWNVRERECILRRYLLRALLGAPPERGEGLLPRRDHVEEVYLRSEEEHPGVEFPAGATETQVEHGGDHINDQHTGCVSRSSNMFSRAENMTQNIQWLLVENRNYYN